MDRLLRTVILYLQHQTAPPHLDSTRRVHRLCFNHSALLTLALQVVQTEPIAQYLSSVILCDSPRYSLDLRSTCLPLVCAAAVLICRSSKSLYIVGIEIRPYWQPRILFPECTSDILSAAVFLTRLPCASTHHVHLRASSSTSLNVRSASASLLGCFEYDGTRYGIGWRPSLLEWNLWNWRLDSGLSILRLAAPHNLRHLLRTRFEEMELSVFLCQPCECRNR
ncbi:hypothetical protein EV421DRAFT_1837466 [Armillaria borealis]|uniref:Uncharacterized protein n=1 Tax=Armillaria borealis TaxID=47425 RepID=A0AA39MHG1_9AGAR|nr:hypothetical protein EV421DRAFT_1837466 [Armillaria borealis]